MLALELRDFSESIQRFVQINRTVAPELPIIVRKAHKNAAPPEQWTVGFSFCFAVRAIDDKVLPSDLSLDIEESATNPQAPFADWLLGMLHVKRRLVVSQLGGLGRYL